MGCVVSPGSTKNNQIKVQNQQSEISDYGKPFSVGSFQSINSDQSDTFDQKEKLYNLIEQGNHQKLLQLLMDPETNIDLTDDLGWTGLKWNTIHYACFFDRKNILEFIMNFSFQKSKDDYLALVNSLTWEHWSPAMVCCVFNSHTSLQSLLNFGGIDVLQIDRLGRTALDLAKSFKSKQCIDLLQAFSTQKQISSLLEPNLKQLQSFKSENAFIYQQQQSGGEQEQQQQKPKNIEKKQKQQEESAAELEDETNNNSNKQPLQTTAREEEIHDNKALIIKENSQNAAIVDNVLTMSKIFNKNNNNKNNEEQEEKYKKLSEQTSELKREEARLTDVTIGDAIKTIKEESLHCREWIMNCVSQQINFADDEFPLCIDCLTYKSDLRSMRPILSRASWMRPAELFRCSFSEMQLFGSMKPSDIMVGQMHHPSIPAIFCALADSGAQNGKYIRDAFFNLEKNMHGVYSLRFYLDGKPREVLIDEWQPGRLDVKLPLFTSSYAKELWPFLLEKAYAKTTVNYVNTEKVSAKVILQEILPGPVMHKTLEGYLQDFRPLMEILRKAADNGYVAVAKTKKKLDDLSFGLIESNAYQFVDVVQVSKNSNVILMRNPFGSFQKWKGEFSLTARLEEAIKCAELNRAKRTQISNQSNKVEMNISNQNQGITQFDNNNLFCISVKEFLQFFHSITISEVKNDFIYNYIDSEIYYRRAQYWTFKLPQARQVAINIYQKMIIRAFNDDQYKYSPIEFRLFKKNPDKQNDIEEVSFSSSAWKSKKNASIMPGTTFLDLEAGQYFIRAKVFWYHKGEKLDQFKVVISTYSDYDIKLDKVSRDEGKRIKSGYNTWLINQKIASKSQNCVFKLEDKGCQCYSTNFWDQNQQRLYIIVQNRSQQSVKAKLQIISSNNIKISKYSSDQVDVLPNNNNMQYFLLKQVDLASKPEVQWKISYSINQNQQ